MSVFHKVFKSSLWYIALICLLMALITWWWFENRIEEIDERIEIMHQ